MSTDLAILACDGDLPVLIAEAQPEAKCFGLQGVPHKLGDRAEVHQIEKIGGLFEAMKAQGAKRVVLAGSLARPPLDPTQFDPVLMSFAPRLMMALQQGDDALLSQVIAFFEENGFEMIGAHEVVPELLAEEGLHAGPEISTQDQKDIAKAQEILSALSPLDVGQGCAVSKGLCLGIETVQGTDFNLKNVSQTSDEKHKSGGVYVKSAKVGQDLRVDMPAIGPDTIQAVADARLSGLVVEAGKTMILNRAKTIEEAEKAGVFLSAQTV